MSDPSILDKYIDLFVTSLPKCDLCRRCCEEEYKCEAFPDGIPNDVLFDSFDKECNNCIFFEHEDKE